MVDVEKVKTGLRICSDTKKFALGCNECSYLNEVLCVSSLASDAAELIALLEERIAIMQESMESLENRNEPTPPRVSRTIMGLFAVCGNCSEKIVNLDRTDINIAMLLYRYCSKCGQAVKWE